MTVTMYDSVNVAAIPADAAAVAGYVDGYGTWPQVVARFPDAALVSITVTGIPGARVGDVESGAMTLSRAIGWASGEVAAGRRPTLYFSISLWPLIIQAVRDAKLSGQLDYWVAQWDGHPVIPAGCVAKQYAASETGSGGDYDLSVANLAWAEGVDMSNLTTENIANAVADRLWQPGTKLDQLAASVAELKAAVDALQPQIGGTYELVPVK